MNRAGDMDKRVRQIKELRMALGFLEKEVSCLHIPLSRALSRTAQFCKMPVAALFSESAQALEARTGTTAAEAWIIGLNKISWHSKLKKTEIDLLAVAAPQLGMSDAAEQKKLFSLLQEELSIIESQARQDAEAGNKIWRYGGFMLGVLVVLLLL